MNYQKILNKFSRARIGVVGDIILDQYIEGRVERISPEAPAPIVSVAEESFAAGGAGNTASNIASLGAEAYLFGLIGKDVAGDNLKRFLKKNKVNYSGVADASRPTTVKKRIVSSGHQMLRLDYEVASGIRKEIGEKIIASVSDLASQLHALVVSDYAKGVITSHVAERLLDISRRHKIPLLVDTKPKHFKFFKGATLLTPNQKEAEEIAGFPFAGTAALTRGGKFIARTTNAGVVITLGAKGMAVFAGQKYFHIPSKAKEVFDVTGAGDTATAVMAVSLASGANLEEAAYIANAASGIVVGKAGTAFVTPKELKSVLL